MHVVYSDQLLSTSRVTHRWVLLAPAVKYSSCNTQLWLTEQMNEYSIALYHKHIYWLLGNEMNVLVSELQSWVKPTCGLHEEYLTAGASKTHLCVTREVLNSWSE